MTDFWVQYGAMNKQHTKADIVENICTRYQNNPAALIEILHDVQEELGYIPEKILPDIAMLLNITRAETNGVVSFYEDFKTTPQAKTHLKICRGEACQAMGANALIEQAKQLEANRGKEISYEAVYCLGNCALAPAMMIGERLFGRLDEQTLERQINKASS